MKIYAVKFINYTSPIGDKVKNNKGDYLDIPTNGELLVKESDLDSIKEYGGGLASLTYIGELKTFD